MEFGKIKMIVEGAFKPHRCVAEDWDYGYLRFQVTTQDGKRWTVGDPEKAPTEKIWHADTQIIRDVIDGLRSKLRAKGYPFDEWSWPEN